MCPVHSRHHRILLCLLVSAALSAGAAAAGEPQLPTGTGQDWWNAVRADIEASEYHVTWQAQPALAGLPASWQAPNRAHDFRTYFTPEGVRVVPRREAAPSWEWGLSLVSWGREGAMQPAETPRLSAYANRIDFGRIDIAEWYLNDRRGVEQGFTIATPPDRIEGDPPLRLDLALGGTLHPILAEDRLSIDFATPDGWRALHYAALLVTDASGRELPAWFEGFVGEGYRGIRIVVDDRGARYPVTIDPLATSPSWSDEGSLAQGQYGWAVAAAGDVNGDGYGDVIVGAPFYDSPVTDAGRAFLYYGTASGLRASPGWTAGADQAAYYGLSVATAGDVNGDTFSDVIVGAPHWTNGNTNEGAVFVYLGSASGPIASPADWTAEGQMDNAELGWSVATAGDVNGDGYSEIIAGAPRNYVGEANEGSAFVWLGSSTGLGSPGIPSNADWTAQGNLVGQVGDHNFGTSVATAGDVNGDGYSDVIIGDAYHGRAYAWLGSSTGLGANGTPANADWMVEDTQASCWLGDTVATAGDVNGDGYSDVIVASPYYDNGQTNEGKVFVYHGASTGLATTASWSKEMDQANADFGSAAGTAGDVNGDGYSDVIIGAYYYDNVEGDEGRAFVFFGSSTGLAASAAWTYEPNQTSAHLGVSAATAGDVNGDGYSDVIVGAHTWDVTPNGNEGIAYVFHGGPAGLANSGWNDEYDQAVSVYGTSVASAGDVNGDSIADILIGAPGFDNGEANEGRVFVYHGSVTGPGGTPSWYAESNQAGAQLGASVASAGDVNGDGYSDIIVGAPAYDNGQSEEGSAFVWLGGSGGLGALGTPAQRGLEGGGRPDQLGVRLLGRLGG